MIELISIFSISFGLFLSIITFLSNLYLNMLIQKPKEDDIRNITSNESFEGLKKKIIIINSYIIMCVIISFSFPAFGITYMFFGFMMRSHAQNIIILKMMLEEFEVITEQKEK